MVVVRSYGFKVHGFGMLLIFWGI